MNWTCVAAPIWNLFGNPLISSLMTMVTQIDPPDSVSVPRRGPAATWGILTRQLSLKSCWKKTSRAPLRWDRRLETQQPLRVGGPDTKTSSGWPQGWARVGEKKKNLSSPQIRNRQLTEFVYFFKDGASFLYLCNRRVPNSAVMQLWQQFVFLVLWNSCSRPEQCT